MKKPLQFVAAGKVSRQQLTTERLAKLQTLASEVTTQVVGGNNSYHYRPVEAMTA